MYVCSDAWLLHTAIHLPQGHTVSSDSFRNFVTLEFSSPRQSLHRAAILKLKVQSFEAVVWLPIADMVSSVLGSLKLSRGKEVEKVEVACVKIMKLFFELLTLLYTFS